MKFWVCLLTVFYIEHFPSGILESCFYSSSLKILKDFWLVQLLKDEVVVT